MKWLIRSKKHLQTEMELAETQRELENTRRELDFARTLLAQTRANLQGTRIGAQDAIERALQAERKLDALQKQKPPRGHRFRD